jgi:hypothetical protein
MRDDAVGDVDGEVISRIARASLRHEEKVPGSIIGRSSLRDSGQGNKTACDRRREQKPLHHYYSEALSVLPRIYGEERERVDPVVSERPTRRSSMRAEMMYWFPRVEVKTFRRTPHD